MRQPINETYSPFCPSRRERRRLRFEWIIAAAALSLMLWYCGWLLAQAVQVTNPLGVVYERVVGAVSGR